LLLPRIDAAALVLYAKLHRGPQIQRRLMELNLALGDARYIEQIV
jgi:hypothetical protein